jgi:hypothetical protein
MFGAKTRQFWLTTTILPIAMMTHFVSSLVPQGLGSFAAPAYASERVRWTPNPGRGQVGSTLSGGRRGQERAVCHYDQTEDQTALRLLVPDTNQVALTTWEHPTFAWHISTQRPVTMTFILSHPHQANPIYAQTLQADRTGIVSISLDESVSLEPEIWYRWTVLVACAESPTNEIYARSFIERIEPEALPADLPNQSVFNQAIAYAAVGIWHDALGSLLLAQQQEPENTQVAIELDSLLHQAIPGVSSGEGGSQQGRIF